MVVMHFILAFEIIVQECEKLKRIRRWWVRPHLKDNLKERYGAYATIFQYFKLHDHEEFYAFVGMTVNQFDYLHRLVHPILLKRSFRRSLATELRLAAVLNYLAHGNDIKKSSWFFRVGRSTMYRMVPEVCNAICMVLKRKYLSFPTNTDEWKAIAENFKRLWHMPNCLGAVDGKHVRVKAPPNSGSKFFNYKKFFSLVFMAMSDGYQRFIWVNIGDYGGLNDAGIFQWSDLGQSLERGEVEFPQPCRLPGSGIIFPHFVIGDGGFALKNYFMRPFSKGINYGNREKIFNYRLSRARRIIECAFGTLTRRWRILESALDWKLETSEIIVLTLVCMHNFLITDELNIQENLRHYICNDNADDLIHNDEDDDNEDDNDNDIYDVNDNDIYDVNDNDDEAILRDHVDFYNPIQMRQTLANYFLTDAGAIPWQQARAHVIQ